MERSAQQLSQHSVLCICSSECTLICHTVVEDGESISSVYVLLILGNVYRVRGKVPDEFDDLRPVLNDADVRYGVVAVYS
jgi:hypothetical protein